MSTNRHGVTDTNLAPEPPPPPVPKVAVTAVAAFIVTTQEPVPEQPPPDHPVNVEPRAAVAVSVTTVPALKLAEHVPPQLMPAGALVTVPEPAPDFTTESTCVLAAVTVTPSVDGLPMTAVDVVDKTTLQDVLAVPVPTEKAVEPPTATLTVAGAFTPFTVQPPEGVSVAETVVAPPVRTTLNDWDAPAASVAVAADKASEPSEGLEDTVKLAPTLFVALIVTWQVLEVPEHAPLQPPNTDPAAGVAVSVTTEFNPSLALQALPQSISGRPKLRPVCVATQLV